MSLTNTLTSKSQLPKFQTTNAVLGPFFLLGKLDNCGAMTAQMLEGAQRRGDGPTIEQLQMAMVTACYNQRGPVASGRRDTLPAERSERRLGGRPLHELFRFLSAGISSPATPII